MRCAKELEFAAKGSLCHMKWSGFPIQGGVSKVRTAGTASEESREYHDDLTGLLAKRAKRGKRKKSGQ